MVQYNMSYTDISRTTQHFERSPASGCASKSIASSPQPAIAPAKDILARRA
ncbi:MAG: hypothetical protein GDA56_27970 [Hormoscilla sp. GM7CHS1pb]|nr:hypothetical protein [Hormoscilla sp. GM7CHS1pb]